MKHQGSKFYAEETHGQKLDPFLNKGVGTNANQHQNLVESQVVSFGMSHQYGQASYSDHFNGKPAYNFEERRQTLLGEVQQDLDLKFNVQHPNKKCPEGNQITHFCANPSCEANATFCSVTKCRACGSIHDKCQKSDLKNLTTRVQNRSKELRGFIEGFFAKQDNLYLAALERRKMLIQEAYTSGLDRRHVEVMEEIYFKPQGKGEVLGGFADDLEERLKGTDLYRGNALKKDPLRNYEYELGKINTEMQVLERSLFDCLAEKRQVKTLQISKYGYYDITSALFAIPPEEKRIVSHLTITNTGTFSLTKPQLSSYQEYLKCYLKLQVDRYSAYLMPLSQTVTNLLTQPYFVDKIRVHILLLQPYHLVLGQIGKQRSIQSRYRFTKAGINGKVVSMKEPFLKEFAQFSGLTVFTLKVKHNFDDWSCFQDMASSINKKMHHLELIDLYVNEETAKNNNVKWADKLRKGIKVRVKQFAKEGLQSRIVASV